jgi:hypothetical protein
MESSTKLTKIKNRRSELVPDFCDFFPGFSSSSASAIDAEVAQ